MPSFFLKEALNPCPISCAVGAWQGAFDTPHCPMLEGVQAGYEPLIEALRDGPFKEKVPAYRPPARGLSR